MKLIFNQFDVKQNFAEARNHRGIGKVERAIGFVQSVLNRYNIEADDSLIYHKTYNNSKKLIWERIKVLLPFIQQSMNRKRPRFSQYSPNILMFGSELDDYGNIKQLIQRLDDNEATLKAKDYEYVRDLMDDLEVIRTAYNNDWKKYTWLTKKTYDKRNKLNQHSKDRIKRELTPNTKILYYIGDRDEPQQKWRQRWSGPWKIKGEVIDDSSVEIYDTETGNSKWVSVDRIKLYKARDPEMVKLSQYHSSFVDHGQAMQQRALHKHKL